MADKLPRVVVTRPMVGIAHMQVCAVSDVTDAEILAACNDQNPSGTSLGWSSVVRSHEEDPTWGKLGPVQCEGDPTRSHFMVSC